MRIFFLCCGLFSGGVFFASVFAAGSAALGYTPRYGEQFRHFDYVNPQAPKGGQLRLSAFGGYDSLNPFLLKGIAMAGSGLIFDTLMTKSLDEAFSMYALLAEDMALAADGLSVRFRLNPKARFHNGKAVTAADVKASFDLLRSPQAQPQYRLYWGDVKEAVVIDARQLRFDFLRRNPEMHLILAELPVFSRDWIGKRAFSEVIQSPPIGSGPYRLESFDLGKQVSYRRDPNYWAADLPSRRGMYNFDQIHFSYYKDLGISLEAFKAGDMDFFLENNSKRWARSYSGQKFDSGAIVKQTLAHENNAGIQGFVFNTRRALFADRRVRRALSLALDFEWSNEKLFYNQYLRCNSYFSNSEMAASGRPRGSELAIIKSLREQLPQALLRPPPNPPSTASPTGLRGNLKKARNLLEKAGWKVRNGRLLDADGKSFEFEIMLAQKAFERIVAPFARNLAKLGVVVRYRTVDASLYQRRADSFDFDMMVVRYGQSQSPGNELRHMFHSDAATREGSQNYAGIQDAGVDALIDKVIYAPNRAQLVAAARALDRALLYGEYLIPHWYIDRHRVAYYPRFGQPATLPKYYEATDLVMRTWWAQR